MAIDGSGVLDVVRGVGVVATLVARMSGHRRNGVVDTTMSVSAAPVHRSFGSRPGRHAEEEWTRTIDGRRLTTSVRPTFDGFVECRRPLELRFVASVSGDREPVSGDALSFDRLRDDSRVAELVRATVRLGPLRIPVPARWLPHIVCRTRRSDAALFVHVRILRPSGALIVDYAGTLSGTLR